MRVVRKVFLGVGLLFALLSLWGGRALVGDLPSLPIFQVRTVEIQWPPGAPHLPKKFKINPPASIFHVHLGAVHAALERQFPAAQVRQVERVLPNRVVVWMQPRSIIAQVPSKGLFYSVSDDGIVVTKGRVSRVPNLPLLFMENVISTWEVGGPLRAPGFWAASELLSAINRQGGIRGQKVMMVKVQDENLAVFLNSGLEIRFAQNDLAVEWQRLWELVAQRWETLKRARYVDLRYEDPIIGNRT